MFYLDCDTSPQVESCHLRTTSLQSAIDGALALLGHVTEGQIGIYKSRLGDGFAGYAIKYPGETPYFEPASGDA